MSNTTYNVGDVLYVIPNGGMKVVPVRVIEIVVRKNMDGESINHIVEDENGKRGEMNDTWHVFTTHSELMNFMVDNAKKNIEKIVTEAVRRTERWRDPQMVKKQIMDDEDLGRSDDDYALVDLGDGRFGKLKKPPPSK